MIEGREFSEKAKKRLRKKMFYIANSFTQMEDQERDSGGRFVKAVKS